VCECIGSSLHAASLFLVGWLFCDLRKLLIFVVDLCLGFASRGCFKIDICLAIAVLTNVRYSFLNMILQELLSFGFWESGDAYFKVWRVLSVSELTT